MLYVLQYVFMTQATYFTYETVKGKELTANIETFYLKIIILTSCDGPVCKI